MAERATGEDALAEGALYSKVVRRLIPLLFICYIACFLDRVNVGFAKLQMAPDLALSDAVYGFGAGVFFIGYFIFEVPSNLVLQKIGARVWIARIMVTWGLISAGFMFTGDIRWGGLAQSFGLTDPEFTFYFLRFLLGAAEAGFFPGVILYLTYWFPAARRAQMVGWFMSAIAASNVLGAPISGAIMQYFDGVGAWRGWQWLFLLEALPSIVMGVVIFAVLPDGPRSARWLAEEEKVRLAAALEADEAGKHALGRRHSFLDAFADFRVWALALVYFCIAGSFYAVNFWMPTIVQELGIPRGDFLRVGLITVIPWGIAAVAMVLWSKHSDRTGERRWHVAGGLLVAMAGFGLLMPWSHDPILSIVALTLVTVGSLSAVVTFWSLPTAFLTGTAAAAGIAWINSIGNLGGHFGPDLIGRIREANNGAAGAAFLTLGAIALLGALITIVLPKTQATLERKPAAT
ncbi:MAG: MFS transporter [Hyphomonadaceae bacterium]|nr:MFS transporter [Hyphomonadaceae bacterium]